MFQINRAPEPIVRWIDFEPVEVLYEYDGPMIFTCRAVGGGGELFLAYFCGLERGAVRFLVVPTTEDRVRRLKAGDIDLLGALTLPSRMYVFELDGDWEPRACWRVTPEDLPARLLPRPGVMLHAGLKSVTDHYVASSGSSTSTTTFVVSGGLCVAR